jgi:hypothetical protein
MDRQVKTTVSPHAITQSKLLNQLLALEKKQHVISYVSICYHDLLRIDLSFILSLQLGRQ